MQLYTRTSRRPPKLALVMIMGIALLGAPSGAGAQSPLVASLPSWLVSPDTTSAYARRQAWFSRDKGLHFGISAAASAGVYAAARELGAGVLPAVALSTGVVGTAGLLREVYDPGDEVNYLTRRFLSRRDLFWDAIGIAVGISATHLLFRGRWERESRPVRPVVAPLPPPPGATDAAVPS